MTDWASAWDERDFSVGVAPQASITAAPGAWVWQSAAEMPQVTTTAAASEGDRTTGRYAEASAPYVGGITYEIAIRQRVEGQPVEGGPGVLPGLMACAPLVVAPQAVESVTVTPPSSVAGSSAPVGVLLALATGPLGFMAAATTTSLPVPASMAGASSTIATATGTTSPAGPTQYYAIRVAGVDVDTSATYLGCVYRSMAIEWADDGLWATHTFVAYGGRVHGGAGGLTAAPARKPLGPGAGRRYFADAATAGADGMCSVRDLSLTAEWPHWVGRAPRGPSAPEGVCTVVQRSPRVTGQASVAATSDVIDTPDTETTLSAAYRARSPLVFAAFEGGGVGGQWAVQVPGARLTAPPELAYADGVGFWSCQWAGGAAGTMPVLSVGVA